MEAVIVKFIDAGNGNCTSMAKDEKNLNPHYTNNTVYR